MAATINIITLLGYLLVLCGASKISLEVTPNFITKDISRTLSIHCALLDTAVTSAGSGSTTVKRDVTETQENVKYVTSILVTRNTNAERVAMVDDRTGVQAEADPGQLKVSGDVSKSHNTAGPLSERARLDMIWDTPGYNQSGGYTCEINAVDPQGHAVVFSTSVEVGMTTATQQDMLNELIRLDAEDRDRKTKLASLESKLSLLEPAHSESGTVNCGDSNNWHHNGNSRYTYKDVRFRRPYTGGSPVVNVAVIHMDVHRGSNLRMNVAALTITANGFRVQCETWDDSHMYNMSVRWTSVAA